MTDAHRGQDSIFTPLESEKYVLGACIQSPDALAGVLRLGLDEGMFYRPMHADMWRALLQVEADGEPLEPVAIADRMDKNGNRWGNAALLVFDMVSAAYTPANADYHAQRVIEGHKRRTLSSTGTKIAQMAAEAEADTSEIMERASASLEGLEVNDASSSPEKVGDLIDPMRDYFEQDAGRVSWTGFNTLDAITGGFRAGQMVIVAARPGAGKSTLSLDIARNVTRAGAAALYFTMEMGKPEIVARALSAEAQVDLGRLTHNTMYADETQRAEKAVGMLESMPLYIDDAPGLTISELRAKSRRIARETDLGLIVVDYIGLITATSKAENRQVEIATYSRALKMLAKELGVPVLVVVQLGRAAAESDQPKIHHLRESGALEQDADKVILLYKVEERDEVTADVVKNRSGELGQAELLPMFAQCRFLDPEGGFNPLRAV